jgi:hypothetical protein
MRITPIDEMPLALFLGRGFGEQLVVPGYESSVDNLDC